MAGGAGMGGGRPGLADQLAPLMGGATAQGEEGGEKDAEERS